MLPIFSFEWLKAIVQFESSFFGHPICMQSSRINNGSSADHLTWDHYVTPFDPLNRSSISDRYTRRDKSRRKMTRHRFGINNGR